MNALFNNYPDGVSFPEVVGKEVRSLAGEISGFIRNGKNARLLCYPELPGSRTTIFKIARNLGLALTNKPERGYKAAVYFENTTLRSGFEPKLPAGMPQSVINRECLDIGKHKVDADFRQVFGYGTEVDPVKYSGIAVEKSPENARHDGRLVECPLESPNPSCIYQLVIDNRCGNGEVYDLRVPVIGGEIPLVYKKFKREDRRFTNDVHRSELYEVSDLLGETEQKQILQFAAISRLDFGELDVLRHAPDGRLFIVDVNNTPYGPPAGLPEESRQRAVQLLADCFRRKFL